MALARSGATWRAQGPFGIEQQACVLLMASSACISLLSGICSIRGVFHNKGLLLAAGLTVLVLSKGFGTRLCCGLQMFSEHARVCP